MPASCDDGRLVRSLTDDASRGDSFSHRFIFLKLGLGLGLVMLTSICTASDSASKGPLALSDILPFLVELPALFITASVVMKLAGISKATISGFAEVLANIGEVGKGSHANICWRRFCWTDFSGCTWFVDTVAMFCSIVVLDK